MIHIKETSVFPTWSFIFNITSAIFTKDIIRQTSTILLLFSMNFRYSTKHVVNSLKKRLKKFSHSRFSGCKSKIPKTVSYQEILNFWPTGWYFYISWRTHHRQYKCIQLQLILHHYFIYSHNYFNFASLYLHYNYFHCPAIMKYLSWLRHDPALEKQCCISRGVG